MTKTEGIPTYRHWDEVPDDVEAFLIATDFGFAFRFDEGKSLTQTPTTVRFDGATT